MADTCISARLADAPSVLLSPWDKPDARSAGTASDLRVLARRSTVNLTAGNETRPLKPCRVDGGERRPTTAEK